MLVIDMTDRRIDHLVVISRNFDSKKACAQWNCVCDCGNTVVVSYQKLTRDHSIPLSCGCAKKIYLEHKTKTRIDKFVGKEFDHLVILSVLQYSPTAKFRCKCKCGNTLDTSYLNLISKRRSMSCGCKKYDPPIGKRFGNLVVLHRAEKPTHVTNRESYWLCQCDCGNTLTVMRGALTIKVKPVTACRDCRKKAKKGKLEEHIGKKFNKLVIEGISQEKDARGRIQFICKCECGGYKLSSYYNLKHDKVKACGCVKRGRKKSAKKETR